MNRVYTLLIEIAAVSGGGLSEKENARVKTAALARTTSAGHQREVNL
jgi:hypothetical protein